MTNDSQPTLPEYANNLFITTLPPIRSQVDFLKLLNRLPTFDEKERGYSHVLRKHCVLRLNRFFAPMAHQIVLAERIDMLIRQGYIGRNPQTGDYVRRLQNGAERIEAGSLITNVSQHVVNTASAFALAGCSGMGKSLTTESILRLYPQLIHHTEPFSLIQIVWLKLECPTQGSPRQLCINFFKAVDSLVGTDYFKRFGGKGTSAEAMLGHMAQVAELHALGVLVIDEIQNLNNTVIGPDALLNFLLMLINTIGIPVILIGTLASIPLLQGTFRNARRANGLGSAIWDRLLPGKELDAFVDRLWACQWTKQVTQITPEIRDVLYEESQGIVDLIVKLYILAQFRLIGISEFRKNAVEGLTPQLFKQVAREHFRIVRPMLDALRNNDMEKLKEFDDLTSLQEHIARVINTAMLGSDGAANAATGEAATVNAKPKVEGNVEELLRSALAALNVADDVAKVLVADLVAKNPSGDPLVLLAMAAEQLAAKPIATKSKSPKKEAKKEIPENDLRRLVSEGAAKGKSGYEALVGADVLRSPLMDFAA